MKSNEKIQQVEITPEIIQKYENKGLYVDRFYNPIELANLKIIPSKKKSIAAHQFIRREIAKGNLKAIQEASDTRENYYFKKVKGMWILEYLNSRGLLA